MMKKICLLSLCRRNTTVFKKKVLNGNRDVSQELVLMYRILDFLRATILCPPSLVLIESLPETVFALALCPFATI